tara:strand:- start:138 stop:296 length:159 start_codon:yes stop_codon:yes gene_type:complete
MASPTQQTKKIRKHKRRSRGADRKAGIRQAQRLQSESVLEKALGERISLLKR